MIHRDGDVAIGLLQICGSPSFFAGAAIQNVVDWSEAKIPAKTSKSEK